MEGPFQTTPPADEPDRWAWPPEAPAPRRKTPSIGRERLLGAALLVVTLVAVVAAGAVSRGQEAVSAVTSAATAQPQAAAATAPPEPTAVATQAQPTPTTATAPTRILAAPDDDQTGAIKQVIQRGNDEQAQAIAAKDPSIMADTSASDYYQELVQTNQDMLDHGVTAIKLVNLEWGAISVNGSQATATTYETWSTTYSDGTTELSRDQNDYTLVLDGSAWKIKTDDHPQAQGQPGPAGPGRVPAPGAPTPQQPQPSIPGLPGFPNPRDTSHNWAGYAATGGTFTSVTGTWTVPQFTPDGQFGTGASWVGIGGVNSRDLIQAGTQETVTGAGSTQYEAWIETLPRPSHPVPLSVHPGDSITVSLTEQSPDNWLISLTDNTTGQNYQTTVQYTSSRSSAEWVEEAPSGVRRGIMPLYNFGTVSFTDGSAVKDGQTVNIAGSGATSITMLGANNQPIAVTSPLGSDGASFTVTRTDNPSTSPNGTPFRRRPRPEPSI